MDRLLDLLREARPEIVGGLVVAAVLAVVSIIAALTRFLWNRFRPKPKPPVVEEEEEKLRPQPPRRPEPRFIPRHDREGRDLVKRVSETLGANGLVIIWGSGGVGKTTLAIEVAHRLCPRPYSGGVIWDTADGRADFALVTLLDKVVTDLGREEARTLALEAKAYVADRLLTEAMPCLLGLDNFETIAEEEQTALIAFLNELSCPVLVTSRERLRIGQNIPVGPMTPNEAKQFLEMRRQQSEQPERLKKVDWAQIAEVAEYNPMLMRWVVAQLEQAMRSQDVFDDIARGKGETIDRIFGRTFRLLGEDGQMALLALALFVTTANREALAAVCGFEDGKDTVNEAIRALAAFDLLDTAIQGDRLGIVALTRRLTEAQLNKDERTEGLKERFVGHFLDYAKAHPQVTKEDLDALDDERENLLAALDYAAEDWESVMNLAGEICSPARGLLGIRGYWDEAIRWGERAAQAAGQAGLPATAAAFSGDVGTIRGKRGDYAEAQEAYHKALAFFQQAGDERNVATALHNLGIIAQHQGNYSEAKDLYNQSLETFKDLGAKRQQAAVLHQLGMIAQFQGNYSEAKDLYSQSLKIARNLGLQAGLAKCLHNLGIIAQHQGNYSEAKDFYSQSLVIQRDLGDQEGMASSLSQLGIIAGLQGDYDLARGLQNQSFDIRKELGDRKGIATCLHNLGIVAQHLGDYQEAKDLYNQSLEIKRDLGDQAGIASSLGQLGSLSEERGNMEEAAQFYREALAIFQRIGSPGVEMARRDLARVTGKNTKE